MAEVQRAGSADDVEIAEFGGVGRVELVRLEKLDEGAAGFGAMPEVNPPFLIPDGVERSFRDRAERRGDVRPPNVPNAFS